MCNVLALKKSCSYSGRRPVLVLVLESVSALVSPAARRTRCRSSLALRRNAQSSTSTASLSTSTSTNGGSATSNWMIVISIGLLASLGSIVENDVQADADARSCAVDCQRWRLRGRSSVGFIFFPTTRIPSLTSQLAKWLRGRRFAGILMSDETGSDWPSRYPPPKPEPRDAPESSSGSWAMENHPFGPR